MPLHTLSSTDAFVAFDLPDAPAAGIVRAAPKILTGGAQDLARSRTYAFATVGMERGGASAGINAKPEERDGAVAAFVAELTPLVAEGRLSLEAAKGVDPAALAPLDDAADRHPAATATHGGDPLAVHLAGLGPVVAAEKVLGGLEGKRIAIEGFDASGAALADAAAARGATVVAVSTAAGSRADPAGLDPAELRARWAEGPDRLVGDDAEPAWKVFAAAAQVLFTGSKMGAVDHTTAARLEVEAVVPHAPIPYTARALAVMGRRGIAAVPDFVPTAAPLLAWWPTGDPTPEAIVARAVDAVVGALDESAAHDDGLFLGACHRAESFLRTWQDTVPFGRPLAS